jgi:hypothetical protein
VCRRCGAQGVLRDTITRQLVHEPFGHRPTVLMVRVRRYKCSDADGYRGKTPPRGPGRGRKSPTADCDGRWRASSWITSPCPALPRAGRVTVHRERRGPARGQADAHRYADSGQFTQQVQHAGIMWMRFVRQLTGCTCFTAHCSSCSYRVRNGLSKGRLNCDAGLAGGRRVSMGGSRRCRAFRGCRLVTRWATNCARSHSAGLVGCW